MNVQKLAIFQNDQGAIELAVDATADTIWASQKQIAELFRVGAPAINKHISNILEEGELTDRTISKKEIVQEEGSRSVKRTLEVYNLDMVISIGYRVNSKTATQFRKWATKILKQYTTEGFAINPGRIEHNKSQFLRAMDDLRLLSSSNDNIGSQEVVDLSKQFAKTWFNLDAYDKSDLPTKGSTKRTVELGSRDLYAALAELKGQLIDKNEATELFAQEKNSGALEGLFGNVFQSFGGQDVYLTLEEKAAHLLYFVVKNHVFNDGNKRSGAYAFVWFLKETELLNATEISPQALTAITLLVAESDPKEKDKMIGLVLLLLGVKK